MERKIGEIFNIDNDWYQVVKSNGECCKGCAFYEKGCKAKYADVGSCGTSREDWTQVIFKKLEKVGEPFYSKFFGKFYQMYKTYIPAVGSNFKIRVTPVEYVGRNKIFIEIKQNKEDMEVKKLNLKPFDLQKAKDGKPVCTRDGRKARIICFDKQEGFPIIALVETKVNDRISEEIALFNINGRAVSDDIDSKLDLMMLPEKKEGWINIIKTEDGGYCCKGEVNSDYNDAFIENINVLDNRGITVKIEWEE